MSEDKMKTKDLCEQKELLMNWLKVMTVQGPETVDINELEKLVNSIHYLAETIQCCAETEYYETVIKAMEEKEDERWGYNMNHYKNGKFAPSPNMPRSGYRPYMDQEPYIHEYLNDPKFHENMRMGYNRDYGNMDMEPMDRDKKYGQAYSEYKTSKRYYTQTKSELDKSDMELHAQTHLSNSIATMREIWKDADPEHRKHMKAELTAFINELTV